MCMVHVADPNNEKGESKKINGSRFVDDFKCRRSHNEIQYSSNNIILLDDVGL